MIPHRSWSNPKFSSIIRPRLVAGNTPRLEDRGASAGRTALFRPGRVIVYRHIGHWDVIGHDAVLDELQNHRVDPG